MKFLTLYPGSIQKNATSTDYNVSYTDMDSVVGFSVQNDGRYNGSVLDLFNKSRVYPNMAEIDIRNMSWFAFPEYLKELFPNLQSLEIANNNFTLPPEIFPWTNEQLRLPNNLSRTDYFQDHYSASEYLEMPPNVFRKLFNLENNNISDLRNYTFTGNIQKISLKSNGLKKLGNNSFRYTSHLRNLDLSLNEIEVLPSNVFEMLLDLRRLDLRSNKMTELLRRHFQNVSRLEYLSIANNSLTFLDEGVFVHLKELVVLHLEHNSLSYLNYLSFPIDSLKLKKIYLQHNPLKILPEFVFWIRGLVLADLKHTHIRFENFTDYILNLHTNNIGQSIIDSSSDSDISDLKKQSPNPAVIDMSFCNISSLSLSTRTFGKEYNVLLVLLLHFRFILLGNPLHCDCNMNNFTTYVKQYIQNGTIKNEETLFNTWACESPSELKDISVVNLESNATYCAININNCPNECVCYRRSVTESVIVDCRNKMLSKVDTNLPEGEIELWYSNNSIITLKSAPEFSRVIRLDLRFNKLQIVDQTFFENMMNLQYLDLSHNILTVLPQSIQSLQANTIYITPNPLKCDCHTQWTKGWLIKNKNTIKDWNKATCSTDDVDGHVFVELRDEMFVCRTVEFDEMKHVVLPSIVCSVMGIMFVSLVIIIYTFRLEVKVLLFIYFGIHPFDDDENNVGEDIDCVIVHSGRQTDWVMDRLVDVLENVNFNFVVCDMARDFVVGFSFHENLSKTVAHSKRMIFLISQDWNPMAESFSIAWGIAQAKIKETRSNFGILVTHEVRRHEIDDKDIRLFMKRGRYIDSSERLFEDKILYSMPYRGKHTTKPRRNGEFGVFRHSDIMNRCFINTVIVEIEKDDEKEMNDEIRNKAEKRQGYDVFVSYSEEDFDYAVNNVAQKLEELGFQCCIPDRDFVIGASKEENILNSITLSDKTIFVVSPSHVSDEWSLFTFRAAYEKSLREKTNHLIVVIKDETDIDSDIKDDEMRHYLKHYICLHQTDRWFKKKLINSLKMTSVLKETDTFNALEEQEMVMDNVVSADDIVTEF